MSSPLRSAACAAALVLSLNAPTSMAAAATAVEAPTDRAAPSCRAKAPTVAKSALRAKGGPRLGAVRLTQERVDGFTITCAVVDVREKFRKRTTLVTRDMREFTAEGEDSGRVFSIARATRLRQASLASTIEPSGNTFTLRGKIEVANGPKAGGRVRYLVP